MIVGVIGSGSIGPDLAYGFASALASEAGSKVFLVDIRQDALDAGMERIKGYIAKGVSRGKLSARVAAAIESSLQPTLSLGELAGCEYVLEAASEDLEVKRRILSELEGVVAKDCLIGFATSGLPRAQIANSAVTPERCFVNHPFFPAWRSLPIEVVLSGDEALGERMIATLKRLGKVPVVTADVPCFAADDIFCNYISEAARIVEEGVATPAQVDAIVDAAIGGGGPFNVMDLTRGNLLTVHCQELMRDAETGSPWFEAPKILKERAGDAWHDRANPGDPGHSPELAVRVLDRIKAVLYARSYFVVENEICSARELNWMTRMALGFSRGLLEHAESDGTDEVSRLCSDFARANPGFPVPACVSQKSLPTFSKNVDVEVRGGIGILRVMRPEVKNALSAATIMEIDCAMAGLIGNDTVKGIVFTSYDGALAGADILELAALPTPEDCREICLKAHPVLARIEASPKPVVAALSGPVMGGGAEFSMACHARVVGKDLLMSQPEVNLGIIPGYGGTQRLPRLVGVDAAQRLLRTGATVRAAEACELGWAQGAPSDDPLADAIDLASKAAAGEVELATIDAGPMSSIEIECVDIGHRSLAVDAILVDVLRRGLVLPLHEGLAVEADGFARCKATADMDIGMKNFMQNGPRVPALFLHE